MGLNFCVVSLQILPFWRQLHMIHCAVAAKKCIRQKKFVWIQNRHFLPELHRIMATNVFRCTVALSIARPSLLDWLRGSLIWG